MRQRVTWMLRRSSRSRALRSASDTGAALAPAADSSFSMRAWIRFWARKFASAVSARAYGDVSIRPAHCWEHWCHYGEISAERVNQYQQVEDNSANAV